MKYSVTIISEIYVIGEMFVRCGEAIRKVLSVGRHDEAQADSKGTNFCCSGD